MGNCTHRCRDARLVAAADKAAKAMSLATNAEVFVHPLNKFTAEFKDPRSEVQRVDPPLEALSSQIVGSSEPVQSQSEIGFASSEKPIPLERSDSRAGFHLNKQPKHQWSDVDVVITLGHKRLTAERDDTVGMNFKCLESTSPEARWRFEPVSGLEESTDASFEGRRQCPKAHPLVDYRLEKQSKCNKCDKEVNKGQHVMSCKTCSWFLCSGCSRDDGGTLWHIVSVGFPGKALTCPLAPRSVAKIAPLENGSSDQIFRYNADGNLLPGPASQDKLALWVSGPARECRYGQKCYNKSPEHRMQFSHPDDGQGLQPTIVMAVPITKDATVDKSVAYTNKKGVASTKIKQVHVEVEVTRKLQWSVMPEQNHLVMLPRLLRTTHAHSPYFRLKGEHVRKAELEKGSEQRFPLTGQRLIAYSPLLPYILGAAEGSWQKDKFWALCQLLGCPLVDRTGRLDCPVKFKVMHPIPPMGADPGPLSELMKSRARQLLDMYAGNNQQMHDQRLQILWSGGIDTTAVVCAFLQVARPDEKSRLLIRYCARSVNEYPDFFHKFIVPALPVKQIVGHVRDAFNDGPTITGDPADMLMGTLVMAGAFKGRYLDKRRNHLHFALEESWQIVIPAWLRERGLLDTGKTQGQTKALSEDWLAWMHPFVQAAPIPIITVFDWLWWVTYACKYQHDLLRVFYNRSNVSEQLRDAVVNFFQSEEFDRWSFHHHHEKMPDKRVWACYKMPLKDFIFQHTGDAVYRANKTKVQSVRNSWGFELGITDRWEVISFGRFSVSLRRMREKYGRDLDRLVRDDILEKREKRSTLANDYIVTDDFICIAALATGAGFLTLAAFNNAEIFDPRSVNKPSDVYGGDGGFCAAE